MANHEVKNKNVFTKISCLCSSYLCHWENYTGTKAKVCSAQGCTQTKGLVGAHVIKCHGNSNSNQYITPLCSRCNSSHFDDCFKLNANAVLVPVSSRHSCKSC